jgi:hypothetical protein
MPPHFHEKVKKVKPDLAGSPFAVIELSTYWQPLAYRRW